MTVIGNYVVRKAKIATGTKLIPCVVIDDTFEDETVWIRLDNAKEVGEAIVAAVASEEE